MCIKNYEFSAIDFECMDSFEGKNDLAIQIGMVSMKGDGSIIENTIFRSFIKPNKKVNKQSSYASNNIFSHKIIEKLDSSPTLVQLWSQINSTLKNRIVVAHSAGVEKRFLREFPMHGFDVWLDTLQLSKKLYPNLKSYKLGALVEKLPNESKSLLSMYCKELSWHDAFYDAFASLLIIRQIINDFDLQNKSIEVLTKGNFINRNCY